MHVTCPFAKGDLCIYPVACKRDGYCRKTNQEINLFKTRLNELYGKAGKMSIPYIIHYRDGRIEQGDFRISPGQSFSAAQVESLIRAHRAIYDEKIVLPSFNFSNDPNEHPKLGENRMSSPENMDITPELYALWCEVGAHSFSAKDEDKTVLTHAGKRQLACGNCMNNLFAANNTPTLKGEVESG